MDNAEYVGNVKLNLEFYSGEDLYSDGKIEDCLLEIVKNNAEESYNKIIADSREWAVMYHLSHIRQNIVGTVPLDKGTNVLEIGSGCGAITGALSDRAGSVTCVELSKRRSLINAYRNRSRNNIEIIVGNFQEIEKSLGRYDCITLIGVFEYADAYIDAADPYAEFLKIIRRHLNPDGRIIMAIENKLGLKYFAGCREDHCGLYFEGLENYTNTKGVKTFTRRELEKLFGLAGFEKSAFYYPYPDYKFPMKVFSDDYLPKVGELNTNVQNFDRDRMLLFDEAKVFNTMICEDLFPVCTNSFLVEIGNVGNNVIYEKYSNDRAEEFSIFTDMAKDQDGNIRVRKYSPSGKSRRHVENIIRWSELLSEQYKGTKLRVCESEPCEEGAQSSFIEGITLEELADRYIEEGRPDEAAQMIRDYIGLIISRNAGEKFQITPEFTRVFGEVYFEREMHAGKVNDIDMVLNNVIEKDGVWWLIDYEWTFDFPVPVEFIIYRMLHYYIASNNSRGDLKGSAFLTLSDSDRQTFVRMERHFQDYVKGEHYPIRDLYERMGKGTVNIAAVLNRITKAVRIYRDFGEGYCEEETLSVSSVPQADGSYALCLQVDAGLKKCRIDPCETGCILKIARLCADGDKVLRYQTNGVKLAEDLYVFEEDPWIEVETSDSLIKEICITYFIEDSLPEAYRAAGGLLNSKAYKLTKPLNTFKRKLKRALKSNPTTYRICKKIKSVVKGEPAPKPVHPEVKSTERITFLLCPREKWQRERDTKFPEEIKFSILVPLYNTPERYLREMIESVQHQSYENWELCLADGSDEHHGEAEKICREYCGSDPRIHYRKLPENYGISGNTNACIDMASGEYIALFDHDDYLHPSVLYENMMAISRYGADYLYTDEATFKGTNIFNIITKHYKPDFAVDNLRANNYICHFSVFKAELLNQVGRFRPEYDGSQDHDLILRLTEQANKIFHIRKILYYWRSHPASVASGISAKTYAVDAAKRAVQSHLERVGLRAEVESSKAFPTIFRFRYELTDRPKVSVLIPNKDHRRDLKKCVDSILEKSTYDNYEIIVIENNSVEKETFSYYKALEQNKKIRVVSYEGEFNYARINNFGASYAAGEFLLLLNNDTEVISADWIEELLMYGQRADVAAVGAKLYFADETIQHAGIVIGLGADRAAGHMYYGVDRNNVGYMGRLYYAQDVSAVTGACMLVKKQIYHDLGGLDEKFSVAYNDVDFCLRARAEGYLNVFTPYCELYHYESRSRGYEDTPEKRQRFQKEVQMFREKWKKVIEKGDPYYNPNFSLDRSDFYISDEAGL